MQKLANILLDCNNLGRTVASEHLVSTLMEAASLYCCVTVYNVETLSQVLASRMDTGQPVEANELGDAFYTQFLVRLCLIAASIFYDCSMIFYS